MDKVIIHPEYESLRKELETLRQRSSELYLQAEYMQFEEQPLLCSLYETTVGTLLYEEFVLKVQIQILNYEITLRQAYMNRNQKANETEIAVKIESASEKYKVEIEQKEAEIKAAQDYLKSPAMSLEESKELRDLYRMISKALHPDLNPNQTQREKDMFLKAISAYRIGDIHVLRQVALAIADEKITDIPDESLLGLIAKAKKTVREFEERIRKMETQFPFIYRDQLNDENWINEQKVEISERIAKARKQLEELNNYLTILKLWKPESLN